MPPEMMRTLTQNGAERGGKNTYIIYIQWNLDYPTGMVPLV